MPNVIVSTNSSRLRSMLLTGVLVEVSDPLGAMMSTLLALLH